MKLAIVGATGLVGKVILQVLKEHQFQYDELLLVASERSKGTKLNYEGKDYTIMGLQEALKSKPDIAIFSAGGQTSLDWAPRFAEVGTKVIDNSSAWRMDQDKKLIVPEINAHLLTKDDNIIANPNCSTIQLVMILAPLHQKYKIKRVVVSTYQSVTGTGVKAVNQLNNEMNGIDGERAYPHTIYQNALPHCDTFEDNDYTKEEMKLVRETNKILQDNNIKLTATAVRIPVVGGHSESVNIEFENNFSIDHVKQILFNTDGVIVQDDPKNNNYPMPSIAHHKDQVFVGRIRRDHSQNNTLNMWIVADNLRKGAATNTVQIASYLVNYQLI